MTNTELLQLQAVRSHLIHIGKMRLPNEACGFIVDKPDRAMVFELPNRSLTPEREFTIHVSDIGLVVEANNILADPEEVVIWHTHPSGFIGPSEFDRENPAPSPFRNLVISMEPPHAMVFYGPGED